MKKYSELEIDVIFDKIWTTWNNKSKEYAARKALAVTLNSGVDHKVLIDACLIYSTETITDEFSSQLNNFLLKDEWKDIQGDADKLKQLRKEAIKVIEEWNSACKSHWLKVVDVESRLPLAIKALKNKFFKENYKKALDKMEKIFHYKFREGDNREKIILSITWFTNVSYDKHSVINIMEGKYGAGHNERSIPKPKKNLEINHEERKKAVEFFRQLREGKETKGEDTGSKSGEDILDF